MEMLTVILRIDGNCMLLLRARRTTSPLLPSRGRAHIPVGPLADLDCLDSASPNLGATKERASSLRLLFTVLQFFNALQGRSTAGEGLWPGWKSKDSGNLGRVDMLDEIRVLGRLRHPNITMVAIPPCVPQLHSTSSTHAITFPLKSICHCQMLLHCS